MKKAKLDWIIHHVANGAICAECGEVENSYPPYICDSHTHGLDKYDGHLEFQVVVNYGMEENMRLLNTLGMRVQAGERFKSEDFVQGLSGYRSRRFRAGLPGTPRNRLSILLRSAALRRGQHRRLEV